MQAPDSKPRVPVFVSHTGLAKLYMADCMEWLVEREPLSIHAVLTDPPYGMFEYSEGQLTKLRSGRGGVWRIPPSMGGHKRAPLPRFTVLNRDDIRAIYHYFVGMGGALQRVLVPGGHVAIASSPLFNHVVAQAMADAGFDKRGEVVRLVRTLRGGDRPKGFESQFSDLSVMPRSSWEPWVLVRKPIEGRVADNLVKWKTGALKRPGINEPFVDVIASGRTPRDEKAIAPHPSLKPQGFLRQMARALLPLGEGVIFDPFAGSGSTLAACEALGLCAVGTEVDAEYVEMARSAIPRLAALKRETSSALVAVSMTLSGAGAGAR